MIYKPTGTLPLPELNVKHVSPCAHLKLVKLLDEQCMPKILIQNGGYGVGLETMENTDLRCNGDIHYRYKIVGVARPRTIELLSYQIKDMIICRFRSSCRNSVPKF